MSTQTKTRVGQLTRHLHQLHPPNITNEPLTTIGNTSTTPFQTDVISICPHPPYSSIHLTPFPPYFPSHNRKLHLLLSYIHAFFSKPLGISSHGMFRHSNPRNAWITGIGRVPFKPYREEGMIKEPIMWGKKDRRSVGVNKVVFICSTSVRWSSRLLALLGEVPCCSFSRSRQHTRYITPCFTLDNTDSSSAAMRDQLYNSRCTNICLQPPVSSTSVTFAYQNKENVLKSRSSINFFSDFLVGKNKSHKLIFEGEPECHRRFNPWGSFLHHSKPSRRP